MMSSAAAARRRNARAHAVAAAAGRRAHGPRGRDTPIRHQVQAIHVRWQDQPPVGAQWLPGIRAIAAHDDELVLNLLVGVDDAEQRLAAPDGETVLVRCQSQPALGPPASKLLRAPGNDNCVAEERVLAPDLEAAPDEEAAGIVLTAGEMCELVA